MPEYRKPRKDDSIYQMLGDAMERFHADLFDLEVTVGLLFANAGEGADDEAKPLKFHGYPAAAIVEINAHKLRARGVEDATISIDERHWNTLRDAQRLALLDHELCHLEVERDDEGVAKSDFGGRPKLKMRLHDWQLGGFDAVARRHGNNALEVVALKDAVARRRQSVFAWGDDQAEPTGPDMPSVRDITDDVLGDEESDNSTVTLRAGGKSVTMTGEAFSRASDLIDAVYAERDRPTGIDAHHDPDAHLLLDEAEAMTAGEPPAAGPDEPAPSAESDGDDAATVKMPTGPRGKRRRQGV